jgi:hypothetical protein
VAGGCDLLGFGIVDRDAEGVLGGEDDFDGV